LGGVKEFAGGALSGGGKIQKYIYTTLSPKKPKRANRKVLAEQSEASAKRSGALRGAKRSAGRSEAKR